MPRSNILEDAFDSSNLTLQSTTLKEAVAELTTDYSLKKLTSNLNIYVRPQTGSNSNTGLSVAQAFQTLDYALNWAAKTYNLNGNQIKFILNGTFNISQPINMPQFMGSSNRETSTLFFTNLESTDILLDGEVRPNTVFNLNCSGKAGFIFSNNITTYGFARLTIVGTTCSNFVKANGGSSYEVTYANISGNFSDSIFYNYEASRGSVNNMDAINNITAGSFCKLHNSIFSILSASFDMGSYSFTSTRAFLWSDAKSIFSGELNYPAFIGGISNTGKKYRITSDCIIENIAENTIIGNEPGEVVPVGVNGQNYKNTTSGLVATTLQSAIDELAANLFGYTFNIEITGPDPYTASKNELVLVNSTNPKTIFPPASPKFGDRFMVVNSRANTTSTNNITINFSSQPRHGTTNTSRTISTSRGRAEFSYINSTIGWIDIS